MPSIHYFLFSYHLHLQAQQEIQARGEDSSGDGCIRTKAPADDNTCLTCCHWHAQHHADTSHRAAVSVSDRLQHCRSGHNTKKGHTSQASHHTGTSSSNSSSTITTNSTLVNSASSSHPDQERAMSPRVEISQCQVLPETTRREGRRW